ncbi:MAG TPA: threo-3-hydroxy-L-aspartate ammonia-lyase [Bryobacteraceae bacterium]|nr:threo-3-hydroxy-L-aspartate ammonia-lyase [Bryobacteraceae bacterium]
MSAAVQLSDIQAAAERIRAIAHRTPVFTSRSFDATAGASVFFKCENFQRGGAFKIRGASNFVYSIPKDQLARGVVSYSSGNHAQAVALAAASVGIPATIVMPADAPQSKLEATRGYGARVVTYDRLTGNREAIGRRIAQETGATLVPPYDHPWIIAGQGTAALELLDEIGDLDALVAPIGGGGLISGCAIAAKALRPSIRLFGVEPEDANDTYLSLCAGSRVSIPIPNTIADGLRATQPGAVTFPIIQEHVKAILLVSEQEISDSVKFLITRMKMLVEPSGAASAAAVFHGKLPAELKRVGVILSGGNVDLQFLQTLGN